MNSESSSSADVWVDSDSKSDEEKRALKRKQQYYYLLLRVSAIETLVNVTTIVAMLVAQAWRQCYKKMPVQTPADVPNQSDEMPIAIARLQQIQKNIDIVDRYMVLTKEKGVAIAARKSQCSRKQQQQQGGERREPLSYSELILANAALDYQKLLVQKREEKKNVQKAPLSYDCLVLHPKSLYAPEAGEKKEGEKGRESLAKRIRHLVERYRVEEERMAKLATYIALMTREIDSLQTSTDRNAVSQCVRSTEPLHDAPYRTVVNLYDQVAAELDKRLTSGTEVAETKT